MLWSQIMLLLNNFDNFILYFFEMIGIAVGHIYYFLEDVCPNQPGGMRILKTPWVMLVYFILI